MDALSRCREAGRSAGALVLHSLAARDGEEGEGEARQLKRATVLPHVLARGQTSETSDDRAGIVAGAAMPPIEAGIPTKMGSYVGS